MSEEGSDHVLLPRDEEELDILIQRLSELSSSTLPSSDWNAILSAADLLIPRDLAPKKKVLPSEIDLLCFKDSPKGKVIEATLCAFGSQETYNNNQRYQLSEWTKLLNKYYDVALYFMPPPRPNFLPQLAMSIRMAPPEYGILFANLVQGYEPVVIMQTVPQEILTSWNNFISNKIQELIEEGLSLQRSPESGEYFSKDEYDSWYEETDNIVDLARDFYEWAPFQFPDETKTLERLMDAIVTPEPEWDDDIDDWRDKREIEYWTIGRMFEDL